ncbi:MAG: hypothetical protein QM767_08350 [Anaeromyxobacter sp.]
MARPRLPRRVKELRGTLHPEREPKNPATLPGCRVPAPPRGMSAAMRRVWRELAAQVDAIGCYGPSDYTSFRLLVHAVHTVDSLGDDVADSPRFRFMAAASAMLQRFGLDPASRSRVERSVPGSTAAVDPDDEFAQPGLRIVK